MGWTKTARREHDRSGLRYASDCTAATELSKREREVLELICEGIDDKGIAARLGLTGNTVRNHVSRLYGKIGVNRRSAAVIWARERGIGGRAGQ